jgi:hypothetical protein
VFETYIGYIVPEQYHKDVAAMLLMFIGSVLVMWDIARQLDKDANIEK